MAYSIALRLGVIEAERRDAMPKLITMEIPQLKLRRDAAATNSEARANLNKRGHNIVKDGKTFYCPGCRTRRSDKAAKYWSNQDCLTHSETVSEWQSDMKAQHGISDGDPSLRPLELGPMGPILGDTDGQGLGLFGPLQETTVSFSTARQKKQEAAHAPTG